MKRASKRFEGIIKNLRNKHIDFMQRDITLQNGVVAVLYIKQLTHKDALAEQVIRPLVQHSGEPNINAGSIDNVIFADEYTLETDESKIASCLLGGMTVLLFSNDAKYGVVNLKQVEHRSVPIPVATYTLRGPKDCFIEDIETNISLIRYRIKDEKLRIESLEVGARTKTKVAVIYIEDIANDQSVNEIIKRIDNIDIDGVIESGELQAYLLNKKLNLFPQMGIIERSDMACGALLEGKVVIVLEGSGWALVAPKTFAEYMWSCEDFYDNKFLGFFMRFLRVTALLISFVFSSLYIAVVSFHNDLLPSSYMIAIAQSRTKVPFNAFLEVLAIEIIIELIHESLVRVPTKIGAGIGIVGAIIIGQAAVSAGIFSPLLLIVISTSLIASFVPSDFTIMNPFRVLKFVLIFATAAFGFFGLTLVIMIILVNLVSINTFGVPYMAPLAPFNKIDFIKSIFYNKSMAPERPNFLKVKDKTRGVGRINQKK